MARKLVALALVMAGLVAAVWLIPLALAQDVGTRHHSPGRRKRRAVKPQ